MHSANYEIAVVLPCYRNTHGLLSSLKSIKCAYKTAVIVIDDGSPSPPSEQLLRSSLAVDVSLYYLLNETNQGIEDSLNRGLRFAKETLHTKYIARLDAGDTCHPERFNIQKEYLDQHPDIALLGSWVNVVDINRNHLFVFSAPANHEQIARQMYIKNCFIHPTVMFRTSAIDIIGYYSKDFKAAEDYEYFFRFIKQLKVTILDKVLLSYELNPSGISLSKRKLQIKSRNKVIHHYFEFHKEAIIGLMKNYVFLFLPYPFVTWVKKKIFK